MLTIIVGGQFGGEGKGKISAYLAKHERFPIVSRCGGVNSSHTVVEHGKVTRLRLLPTAAVVSEPKAILYGAGTLLHLPTLFREMANLNVARNRVVIDPRAGIITQECIEEQRRDERYANLGSTLTGTGHASAWRSLRSLQLAKDFPELKEMLGSVSIKLFETLHKNSQVRVQRRASILVEGHQGFGLSNYHGDYPYTSSRDCTTAALLSELGLAPTWPMRIVLVIKAFPTRNHAGTLSHELTTDEADAMGIIEYGGGSWGIRDRRRRVGIFDLAEVTRAVRINGATEIALTGVDYLDPGMEGATEVSRISKEVREFIRPIENLTKLRVRYLSTGPETDAMIDTVGTSQARIREIGRTEIEPFLPNILH